MLTEENSGDLLSVSSKPDWEGGLAFRGKKKAKSRFFKSSSLDADGIFDVIPSGERGRPQKPHPLRSPMRSFFRNHTIPRSIKLDPGSVEVTKPLSISPDGSAWTLEDDTPKAEISTVDGTPFSQTSNQLYYKTRPALAKTRPALSKTKKRHVLDVDFRPLPLSSSFTDSFVKRHASRPIDEETRSVDDIMPSIRRRANSLDNLSSPSCSPALYRKDHQYSPIEISKPFFNRTVSFSQRSPFRKRVAFTEPDTSLSGLKEQRPRSFKRHRNNLEALFDAIERQDTEEVRKILEMPDLKINNLNADNFTPLDIALLKGNIEIARLLLFHGAIENPAFTNPDAKADHLGSLIQQADKKVNDFTASIVNCTSDNKESERQLREWEWRLYMLRIMQNTFMTTETPTDTPVVSAAPLSDQSVIVLITPGKHRKRDIVTKYKVEWSTDEDFNTVKGEKLVMDMKNLQYTINGLEKSRKWYIQVRVGNLKGFGPPVTPEPPYIVPSSWHELNDSKPSYIGCQEKLEELLQQILDYTISPPENGTPTLSKIPNSPTSMAKDSPKLGRKGSVFRTMSKYTNLVFHSAPKLLKRIKCRGIYLAAMLINEEDDRVLVTMDENIPFVEVDDNYSKSFTQEFYWLSKVSCTWEDVHQMLPDSTKFHSSHAIQIRRKLLQASMALQSATGVQDLGVLYYKAFKDAHGSILLLTLNDVKKSDCGSRLTTMKWVPVSKLQKKSNALQESIVPQRLIPSLQDQISYERRSKLPVSRGLYIGYLKLRTTVDSLSIVVPDNHPNMLPHVKVRDIPSVTREDWSWIQSLGTNLEQKLESSLSGAAFESKLKAAARKLFSNLGIDDEYANFHRIYDKEVIEFNENVLLILILPPIDDMCTAPGQSDLFHALSGYSSIPVQTFELINTNAYQPEIMRTYARASSILEMETLTCLQSVREALSPSESKLAKERQASVTGFQQAVDIQWRNARWVLDVVQVARDRNCNCGVMVGCLYDSGYIYTEPSNASILAKIVKEPVNLPSSPRRNSTDPRTTGGKGKTSLIKVYGTQEIGVFNNEFVEILVTKETTAQDIVLLASQSMLQYVREPNRSFFESSSERASFLGLVVVSGAKERCLRDDLKLLTLQNPWEKGDIFLRLKKEAYKAAKLSKSTSV